MSHGAQTWRFFAVDPTTHLLTDNIGLGAASPRGTYTSPTNIGVYLWSVVAAMDLGLISRAKTYGEMSRASMWGREWDETGVLDSSASPTSTG
jgi:hypothetical protein